MGIEGRKFAQSASSEGKRFVVAVAFLLGLVAQGLAQAQSVDISLGLCATLVRPWGYPCNEFTVQTDDGFLLGVQNIPSGLSQLPSGAPRTPVFLQHGVFAGGDNWVFNSPSESLAFILADAGYDVWIGNIRCIDWSHGHTSLTEDDEDYWEWSWDELASYDLPAMLGFVYNQKGSKILYIGHSQGTAMLMAGLVGTDQSDTLTGMLTAAVLICPIAYMNAITSSFDKRVADLYVDKLATILGVQEFSLYNKLGVQLIQDVCAFPDVNCTSLYKAVTGNDCCLNYTRVPFYLNFYPQSTSTKNLAHFAQMIRHNSFSMYDYGLLGNLVHYQQLKPPVYDLTQLPASVPLMIVQGGQDGLADPSNVQSLVTLLGTKVTKRMSVDRYAHGDFIVSTTANIDVYPEIMSFIQNPGA